jgi:hypothetical protein
MPRNTSFAIGIGIVPNPSAVFTGPVGCAAPSALFLPAVPSYLAHHFPSGFLSPLLVDETQQAAYETRGPSFL